MVIRTALGVMCGVLLVPATVGHAASGSITDSKDKFLDTDIVRLDYDNQHTRLVMTMTYRGGRPQNEGFRMRWGSRGAY